MKRTAYEKEYVITSVEYYESKRVPNTCYALPTIQLRLTEVLRIYSCMYLDLTQRNFVEETRNYWWDGTELGAHNLMRKLHGRKFSFKNGIE